MTTPREYTQAMHIDRMLRIATETFMTSSSEIQELVLEMVEEPLFVVRPGAVDATNSVRDLNALWAEYVTLLHRLAEETAKIDAEIQLAEKNRENN